MKNYKVILVFILLVLVSAFVFWKQKQNGVSQQNGLINKSRNLTEEQKGVYLDRIQKANHFAKNINPADVNFKQLLLNNYIYLGQQYFGLGELQKSKEMFEQSITYNSTEPQSYVGLAMVYEDAGDTNSQAEALKKAVELAPQNSDIWVRYLNVKKQNGSTNPEMHELYKTALEQTKRKADIIISYANFQAGIGNTKEAIALWQEVILQFPENKAIYQAEINKLKNK